MRVSFSGPAKCSLIFESLKYCPCTTCDSWTTLETQPFKDDPHRTYGAIDLEGYDQVIMFEVCCDHQMLMSLIPYPDREKARTSNLDLFVGGSKPNARWSDNVVFEGNLCVVTMEVYHTTNDSASSSLSSSSPPSPPTPLLVTYRRRSPQLFTGCPDKSLSSIKVEVDNRFDTNTDVKVEVDDYYQRKTIFMPLAIPMPILRSIHTTAPTPSKQEINCYPETPSFPPTLPPRPITFQSGLSCNQIFVPPPLSPITAKSDGKEIVWEQYSFPPPPPPLPPRPRPSQMKEQEGETASFFSKASKHALWRRLHARIRPHS